MGDVALLIGCKRYAEVGGSPNVPGATRLSETAPDKWI